MSAIKKMRGSGSSDSGRIKRESGIIERPIQLAPDESGIRMMLLRDEKDDLLSMMRDPEFQKKIASLLTDPYLGIGPLAAEALRKAAHIGLDIEHAVPFLKEALVDKYAKYESAAALATHFYVKGENEELNRLLRHPEIEVRTSAQMVVMNWRVKDAQE